MKRDDWQTWRRRLAITGSSFLLAGAGVAGGMVQAQTPLPPGVEISSGTNPLQISVNLAKKTFPGATIAILAAGSSPNQIDPVLASSLSMALKAPILLTHSASSIGTTTLNGLKTLGINQVILVGAVAANANAVTGQLPAGTTVSATYGNQTPSDTAVALAGALSAATHGKNFSNVFVVSASPSNIADAVSAAPAAAMLGAPILLAPTQGTLPKGEAAYVNSAGTVYLIGAATNAEVSSTSPTTKVMPISGPSRSLTLYNVDQKFFPTAANVYVVNGENNRLGSGLSVAPLIAENQGALLYMYGPKRATPQGTVDFLANPTSTALVQSLNFVGPPSALPTVYYSELESSFRGLGTGVKSASFSVATKTPVTDSIIGISATVTSLLGKPVTSPIVWSVTGSNSNHAIIESTGVDSANFAAMAPGTYTISAAVDNAVRTTTITVASSSNS